MTKTPEFFLRAPNCNGFLKNQVTQNLEVPFQAKSILLDQTAKAAVCGDDSEFMHSDLFQFRK